MLLEGASGSGKSSLLRVMCRAHRSNNGRLIDLRRVPLPERPIVDLFQDDCDENAESDIAFAPILRRLARVGLAEVWTWLRPPSQLSEGQRWRLRLALAMQAVDRLPTPEAHVLLVCDEFAAVLDRITAFVVAGVLRRFIDARKDRVAAVVATSHDDLRRALEPDQIVTCDFGRVAVRRRTRRNCAA